MKGRIINTTGRVLALVFIGALAMTALPAQGKGGKVFPISAEKCWVVPDPTRNGQESFTVNGSGFKAGQPLAILVGGSGWLMASSDFSGNFAASAWAAFTQTGRQEVQVYESGDRRMTVLATCSFVVQ